MNRKVAYVDLNHSDCIESYSAQPKKYGGGRVVAAAFLDRFSTVDIYADKQCFENVRPGKLSQCKELPLEARTAIKNGEPVANYIPNYGDYDIFIHHFSHIHLNLEKVPQVVWPVGWREQIHPLSQNVMFFDLKHQQPQLSHNSHRLFDIVIGPRVPEFQEHKKEDIIFQCSRHFPAYQTIIVAKLCQLFNVTLVLAGPIEVGYELQKFVDGKLIHYLGVIDQETKDKYNKMAKFNTQFQNYPISVTLAAKEALSFGTPILATPVGGWNDFIKEGINGHIIKKERDFWLAWQNRDKISQRACYDSVLPYSEDRMVESVTNAIEHICQSFKS